MRPAAFVSNGHTLERTLDTLRGLGAKVFATPAGAEILEAAGIHAIPLGEERGITMLASFGHREIHLFGFDECSEREEGARVCLENRIFYTTAEMSTRATELLAESMKVMEKGVAVAVHGDGLLAQMVGNVMRNSNQRTLTAIYDLNVCPPTYEVFSFLAGAEKYRIERGYTNIDVIFLPGPMHGFRDDALPPSVAERKAMLHRVCVAGARLLPSVRNVHVFKARTVIEESDIWPPNWTNPRPTAAYGPGLQINGQRCLEASESARAEIKRRFPKPYTTITMREAEYWPSRNSNFAAWGRAARALQLSGAPAVIVPDTHGVGIPGMTDFPAAAWDIDLRMALYEGARMNFGVAGGPTALLHLAARECAYTTFQKPAEDTPTTQAFHEANGIAKGAQMSTNGRTIWEDDTPENVDQAVNAWLAEARAA